MALALGALILGVPHFQASGTSSLAPKTSDTQAQQQQAQQQQRRQQADALDSTSSRGSAVGFVTPWESEQGLIDRKSKVCMGWTARAACTFAVSIFLESVGLLDKALAYSPFVHNYREQRMDRRFVARPLDCSGPGVTSFKIVRNPFARAASTFAHQMFSHFSDGLTDHPRINSVMTNILGETDVRKVSFVQWLRAVKKDNFNTVDIHSKPQTTAAEHDGRVVFDSVCKLEHELQACLDAVNSRTGANFSVTRAAETSAPHSNEHQAMSGDDVATLPYGSFPKGDKGQTLFPEPADYYRGPKGAEAAALVVELYQVDFDQYKYSTADTTGIGVMSLRESLQRVAKVGREGQQPARVAAR